MHFAKRLLVLLLMIFFAQAIYFLIVLNLKNNTEPSDAIIIFRGTEKRIKTGYSLASQVKYPFIVLSPATESMRRQYDLKYGLHPDTKHLKETEARTTLENAYYISRIIKNHNLRSVTLVTSDYHMPRSLALLRMFTLGDNLVIHTYKVSAKNLKQSSETYSSALLKLVYNEMLEFWGSLIEYIPYLVDGEISEKTINKSRLAIWMKSFLCMDIQPEW